MTSAVNPPASLRKQEVSGILNQTKPWRTPSENYCSVWQLMKNGLHITPIVNISVPDLVAVSLQQSIWESRTMWNAFSAICLWLEDRRPSVTVFRLRKLWHILLIPKAMVPYLLPNQQPTSSKFTPSLQIFRSSLNLVLSKLLKLTQVWDGRLEHTNSEVLFNFNHSMILWFYSWKT